MSTTPDSSGDQNKYPIHNAVKQGKNDDVASLLDADADLLHSVDEHGRTPLHMAVLFQNLAAAEMLISRGANCNEEDSTGRTPLHLAGTYSISSRVAASLQDIKWFSRVTPRFLTQNKIRKSRWS
jgi:ankyrin repeat protein